MGYLVFSTILLCIVAGATAGTHRQLTYPQFLVGKTQVYHVTINTTGGVPGMRPQISKSVIMADLKIYAKTKSILHLSMDNAKVSTTIPGLSSEEEHVHLKSNATLEAHLKIPFKCIYVNGTVKSFILDPRETLETRKIKRTVLRSLEVYLDYKVLHPPMDGQFPATYNLTRKTDVGNYSSHYVITSSPYDAFPKEVDVFNITRTDNYEVIPYTAYNLHHNFESQGCPGECKVGQKENKFGAGCPLGYETYQSIMKRSFVQLHNLKFVKNGPLIFDNIKTIETHIAHAYDQQMQVAINTELRLKVATLEKVAEAHGQSHSNLDDFSYEINEKDVDKFCKFSNTSEHITKAVIKLLQDVAEIVVNSDLSNQTTDLIGEKVFLLRKALIKLKQIDLRHVEQSIVSYNDLPKASEVDKVKRQIWLDVLPVIGTVDAVSFITNIIQENINKPDKDISLWEASSVLSALPLNLLNIKDKTILDLSRLLELVSERNEPGYMIFYSASYLTVSRTIAKACAMKSAITEIEEPPKKTVIDEINLILQHLTVSRPRPKKIICPKNEVDRFITDVVSKLSQTKDNAKRVIYIETLARTGLGEVLPHLLPYLYGTSPVISPSYTNFLKVVAIKSLHALVPASPLDVQNIVMTIYLNRTETAKARVAAFAVFITTDPSLGILQQLAEKTWEETSLEVGSFVTSVLEHYANSTMPCNRLIAHRIKLILPHAKRFDIGVQHSKDFLWDVFDEKREFGISNDMIYAASNESIIPGILYGGLSFIDRGLQDFFFQSAINSQGLRANKILDHIYKYFGLVTADTIPKQKEPSIFQKTNIVPRDPEFWRIAMYIKNFYTVSYQYFDHKEMQMDALEVLVKDFLRHYFMQDPKEGIQGHLVKLFIPSSYYTDAIGHALPHPVHFKKENLFLFSLKLKLKQESVRHSSENIEKKPSKKVKVLIQPSSYYTTLYTNEILNLRDCKTSGVYHTTKTASAHSVELEFAESSRGKFNVTYRFPHLPKQTFAYNSEAGTYAGVPSYTELDIKHRVPIKTTPIRFKKNVTHHVFGLPPIQVVTLSDNIMEGEERPPRDFKEWVLHFFKKYRNAGWRRKSVNVTELAVKDEWSSNTTGSLVIEINRQYPKKVIKPSRELKDVHDELNRPCFGKSMAEANDTFVEEIDHVRRTFKTENHMLDDIIKIQFQQTEQKKIVSKAEINFSYNRTLTQRLHDSELNITAKTHKMSKPLKISMAFTSLEFGKAYIFNYDNKTYDDQKGFALFRMAYSDFRFLLKSMYRRDPFNTTIDKLLERPAKAEYFLPETHKTCIKDKRNGNGYSIACIKAIVQSTRFNTLKAVIQWKQKVPKVFTPFVKKTEVYLKTDFTDAILTGEKNITNLPFNVTYIDKLVDNPVYELYLENYNDTVRKLIKARLPPHYTTSSLYTDFERQATNNSYPATCAVTEKYVTTFDMVNYPLSGDVHMCPYVVATHCVKQKKFAVIANFNVASPGSKEIHMYLGNDVGILTPRNRTGLYTVKYNGHHHTVLPLVPVPLNNKTLVFAYILDVKMNLLVVEARRAGVKVIYDGNKIFVQVSPKYKGELCGLCSDFNGEVQREFLGVDGCLYTDGGDFAKSSTLDHCVDKNPTHPYICPGHKFSADSQEPSSQQEDLKEIPDLQMNEEDENEETRIVMRNMVVSKDDKLCFSVEAVPFCEGEEQPKETEQLDVGFVCYHKNDPQSKHKLAETSYRILSELAIEDCEFSEIVAVAKSC